MEENLIEADREISDEIINHQQRNLKIKHEIRMKKIIDVLNFVLSAIYFFSFIKNIVEYAKNTLGNIFVVLLFFFTGYLVFSYEIYIYKDIENLQEEIENNEKEIEDWKNFSCYVLASRQIEAKEAGVSIYPQIGYDDSVWIKNHDKGKYEKRYIEYEEQHIARLKLNPHYLKEKLDKAPIETYPIREQELLKEYIKNSQSST